MSAHTDEFLGELRLGRRLTTVGQVAAGGLAIAAGLLFLLSGPAMTLIGPQAALAGVLAGIVLGLTLLSVRELLGGSGERGGTYILIQETLGGWGAFIAGWSILSGCIALSAALAQATAGHFLLLFPSIQVPSTAIALAIFAVLVLVQLFQVLPRRTLLWPVVVILLIALAVIVLTVLPRVSPRVFRTTPASDLRDLMRAVAWLAASYAALEAILASRRQIRDPGHHLSPAMLGVLLVGSLVFAAITLVGAGLSSPAASADATLASILSAASPLPPWIVGALAVAVLSLATSGCLMTAARQMHCLSREGGLPRGLRRLQRPFPMPPLLFGVLTAVTGLLIVLAPARLLTDLAAGMFLLAMILLNVAAIHSHRTEPERRRPFVVPFYPLVPAVAIGFNLALLGVLPLTGLLASSLWLFLGLLSYLAYARRQQAVAREGVSVFGLERRRERREGTYRILVPLGRGEKRHLLLRLAAALARQFHGEVIPLQVIPVPDPLAIEEGRRIAQERNILFQWSTRLAEDAGVDMSPITRLARSVSEGIMDTAVEEGCNLILMPWSVTPTSPGTRMGHILDPVVRQAPCDVAVVAFDPKLGQGAGAEGEAAFHLSRILVPTAGGPHAPLATRLAVSLAREYGATVTAIYVTQPEVSASEIAEGEGWIHRTIAAMRQRAAELPSPNGQRTMLEEIPIESRVVEARSVVRGIADAGKEYDLVLIGASNERLIDQVLFGSIPEQIARACPSPVVMVKRYRGLPRFWLQRIWDALFGALPTLSSEERIEVNKQIRSGAQPDVDFFVMMALAALIATLGLLQNSAALIIGAMLVAPLFTSILALSLGIAQGHARLLRLAIEATLKGIALAITVAVILTVISPLRAVTQEIVARTQPNLFDLAVALASGAAGAYAVARKDVAASLPGVAIAAALVPPLAVVGIGLAMGDLSIAGGGGLLFATNLVAIVLAGAVTLLLLGFRPARRDEHEARLRLGMVTTVLLLVLIAIPLTMVFVQSVATSRTRQVILETLAHHLETMPEAELVGFEFESRGREVEVKATLYAKRPFTAADAERLSDELSQAIGKPARLRLVTIPIMEIEALPR